MSTITSTIGRVERPKQIEVEEFAVEFGPKIDDSGLVWKQVNDLMRGSVKKSGFPQSQVRLTKEIYSDWESRFPVLVATGIAVEIDEYKQRFGGINLEEYKSKMAPEMFRVFVRYIGSIPGRPDIDIGDIVDTLE